MQISVIIPLYNAAPLLEKAVLSALIQPAVNEVIIIEDDSLDGSLDIAIQLMHLHPRVKVFQHPDKKNHGAGASRNLGIEKSTCPYIAFLDADDYYLENRFKGTKKAFEKFSDADGIYEAIGRDFLTKKLKEEYRALYNANLLITIEGRILPENLFEEFFIAKKGWFHLNGLVVKRKFLDFSILFDPELLHTQDTDFILRLCLNIKLYPGDLNKPVAMTRIHGNNRVLNKKEVLFYRYRLFKKWFLLISKNNWPLKVNKHIVKGLLYTHPFLSKYRSPDTLRFLLKIFHLMFLTIKYPRTILKIAFG